MAKIIVLLACVFLLVSQVTAQVQRYELGRRIKLLEVELERVRDAERQKMAFTQINEAVQKFFSLRLQEAAASLDKAKLILQGRDKDEKAVWAESLFVDSDFRVFDAKVYSINLKLDALYNSEKPQVGNNIAWRITLTDLNGKIIKSFKPVPIESLPVRQTFDLGKIKSGDYFLQSEILIADKTIASSRILISFVANFQNQIENLKVQLQNEKNNDWRTETLREYLKIFEALSQGKVLETDISVNLLFDEIKAIRSSFPRRWLVAVNTASLNVQVSRVFVPDEYDGKKKIPVVIALHGAGGSENLFFEGYGAGKIVELCRKRGWLLLAPRNFGFSADKMSEFLDSIGQIYQIDKQSVFLIGHSLGSVQALTISSAKPNLFKAVALISAGRIQRFNDEMRKLPIFIGTGTADFSRAGSEALYKFLSDSGAEKVELKVYEGVEHLTAVQFSLDDAFNFFDRSLKSDDKLR